MTLYGVFLFFYWSMQQSDHNPSPGVGRVVDQGRRTSFLPGSDQPFVLVWKPSDELLITGEDGRGRAGTDQNFWVQRARTIGWTMMPWKPLTDAFPAISAWLKRMGFNSEKPPHPNPSLWEENRGASLLKCVICHLLVEIMMPHERQCEWTCSWGCKF